MVGGLGLGVDAHALHVLRDRWRHEHMVDADVAGIEAADADALRLGVAVDPVEAVGWDGDMLEAQCFAYLAARSVMGLPLSLPGTTGVPRPMPGGVLVRATAGDAPKA